MSSEPLVSVIIPVYNTAPYLRRCLTSVINQTYSKLEIIVVNDGSTDNSLSIIREFEAKDDRIICIDKSNEGLALTRRAGVCIAKGKYIQHLDSDDCLVLGAIRMLVDRAENTGADIVALPFYYVYEDNTRREAYMHQFEELSGLEYYKLILHWKCHCNVWANFQRRSLFVEHDIIFVPDVSYGEDLLLITQLLSFVNKVVRCEVPLMYYYQRATSICNANWLRNCSDKRKHTIWIRNYLASIGWDKKLPLEMALLQIYRIFFCLNAGDKATYKKDIEILLLEVKKQPKVKSLLPRRWRKLICCYKKNFWLGNLYLWYYRKKKKNIY